MKEATTIVKNMTIEMKEQYHNCLKLQSYAEACQSRVFIRKKTLSNAVYAENIGWGNFWKLVSNTWPKYKEMDAVIKKDETIIFSKD